MKKLILVLPFSLLFLSCDTKQDECSCYDAALDGNKPAKECLEVVKGLTEEELEEKSNECFGSTVEDMSGATGL